MSLESLAGGMNEMKSTQDDSGNAMKFDPDKRMDVNDNRSLFTDNSTSQFDPDKRMDVNDNRISDLDNETKFDPDKRKELDTNQFKQTKSKEGSSSQEMQNFQNDSFSKEVPIDEEYVGNTEMRNELDQMEQENPHEEIIDGQKYYYDDNGNLYRVNNELNTNNEYEINKYKYRTDENGRIISAEGMLHPKNHDGKLPIKDSIEDIGRGSEREGDDRGHLIGDQFDGSNGLENMIPQDANINRIDFKNFENELAKEMNGGKQVYYKVEPIYDGDSRRPSAIVVTYSINGEENIRVFPNRIGE